MRFFGLILVIFFLSFQIQTAYAFLEKVDGLEYVVRKIEEPPIDRFIAKRFDLYELYFENRSDRTFSIPGYSIDLGVDYSSISEVSSFTKDKSSKKLAVFNVAAGAASIALGGIAKSAANTAMRFNSLRKNTSNLNNDKSFLSGNKTYIIYPNDSLSLFFFLDKFTGQTPASIRYICHDEVQNTNYVVINENLDLRESNADKNVIAAPDSNQYK
ncbi:MAG: hypothetical protein A3I68_08090 [Candidatus Melainabacteria bacterium RIFCSPLOWO2_02_FULL_35_15]|nr:MAG: hypothetical protein A3F80_08315 [Candidatus Melainabacteria bacterium RIFCSPLOWO2_12_FULL_35_11]OGI13938.1 MAG: hypothetical protein A3I68_08090 [Candidatus Melainabacteria bacterium RIFCSPLOWO2_02_FULL_35_15]